MSDYTPTTDDVREGYATRNAPMYDGARRSMFDTWLAAHDREVRADERETCAREIEKWRDDNLHHVPQPADDLAGYYMRSGTIDGATIATQVIREGGQK